MRTTFPAANVGTILTADRDFIRVELTPGGVTELRYGIDRVRLNLICYGADPRTLAHDVRTAVQRGFTAAGMGVRRVVTDPPFPLADPITNEPRSFIGVTASVHALSA
jgi:phosphomannomutase